MPIYSYKCPICQNKLDIDHGMVDEPKVICNNCKVERIKLMGFSAVKFKGGGWGSSPN